MGITEKILLVLFAVFALLAVLRLFVAPLKLAGKLLVNTLLGFALLAGASGWAIYNDLGGHWLEELHEGLASAMLLVVIVHLAGVLSGSVLHGENLVRAMLNGFKLGHREEAIPSARPLAAVALLLWTGAAAWWLVR